MTMRISVFGDSISTFSGMVPPENKVYYEGDLCDQNGVMKPADTWWMQVIDAMEAELLANGSYSGCLVSGEEFPAGCSMDRARQVLGQNGEQPECVLVYMGINDYGEGTSLAEFERAYDDMLENLEDVAPSADIICATLLSGRSKEHDVDFFRAKYKGESLAGYNAAITRAAARHDNAKLADVASCNSSYDTLDGTHPTKCGMRQLSGAVLDSIGA